jgi:hypothetical protein
MKCDLSLFGVYCVFAVGFLTGSLVFGGGVDSTLAAVVHSLVTVYFIWAIRNDGLEPRPGNWVRRQGSFWWHRAPDEPAE